jgi:hypothetical protein
MRAQEWTCLGLVISIFTLLRVMRQQVYGPLRRLLRPAVPRQAVRRLQLRDSISPAWNVRSWRSVRAARPSDEL